jgi:hypothetical protein
MGLYVTITRYVATNMFADVGIYELEGVELLLLDLAWTVDCVTTLSEEQTKATGALVVGATSGVRSMD